MSLFTACQTQWRFTGMGLRAGLDYPGVESLARIYEIKLTPETFSKLQILEQSLIKSDQERHAKQD